MLVDTGKLAVVAEVVQVLVVLLYGPCGGETGSSAVVFPDGRKGTDGGTTGIMAQGRKKKPLDKSTSGPEIHLFLEPTHFSSDQT